MYFYEVLPDGSTERIDDLANWLFDAYQPPKSAQDSKARPVTQREREQQAAAHAKAGPAEKTSKETGHRESPAAAMAQDATAQRAHDPLVPGHDAAAAAHPTYSYCPCCGQAIWRQPTWWTPPNTVLWPPHGWYTYTYTVN